MVSAGRPRCVAGGHGHEKRFRKVAETRPGNVRRSKIQEQWKVGHPRSRGAAQTNRFLW